MDNKWYQKGLDWLLEKDNVDKKWYKRRIVWVVAVVVIVLIMLLNPESKSTEKNEVTGSEIPNVFGVYYEDAIDVLEAEGFEVNAIETDAKSILNNLYKEYDGSPQYYGDRPESLEKGAVFKINDYTQDGVGQLYDNDDIYDKDMVDEDGKIVIYYAKEAYSGSDGAADSIVEEVAELLSFEIIAGEAGEYGKKLIFNKGTEFEMERWYYNIPIGTYKITNIGDYMAPLMIYTDEININEDGWEEPVIAQEGQMLKINQETTVTLEEGQVIYIQEPAVFSFEMQE